MRRLPLMMVTDPALISSGLLPDRHTLMLPFWEVASNVRFYQGKIRRLVPATAVYQPIASGKGRGLHQQQNNDGTRWLFSAMNDGANMRIHRWYGPAPEQVASIAAPVDDTVSVKAAQVDFTQWGNWTLFNLGIPGGFTRRYKPDTNAIDILPNAPDSIGLIKKQNQLMAIGTGLSRKTVAWSDADAIEVWTAAADNLAGSLALEELNTPIRAYARLGRNVAVYAEDQMGVVRYVGQPFIYGGEVLLDGIGAVGKAAVTTDGRLNYGVSRNGIWQTDGNEFRYIDHGLLSDYLQKNVNWAQAGKIVAARNDVTRCIEFHFPMNFSLENSEGWSFDPQTGAWSKVPAFQSVQERMLFDKPIASADGYVNLLDSNSGANAPLVLKSKAFLITNDQGIAVHQNSIIDEVELALKEVSNVEFRISAAEDIDGPWESTPWHAASADLRTYRMEHLPTGTFHTIEFRSTAADWTFDLQAMAFFGQIDGVKRDAL